jgi:hypothetical protein
MGKRRNSPENEGWIREFFADESLARDAVEIYDLLGFEVLLQPLGKAQSKKSTHSPKEDSQAHYQIVYIRPKKSPDEEEDEWI